MALVLDGTNGVSGVDGTASNPAIEGTDSNTGIFYPAADTVAIGTGGTEALRIDSARNMGLGVTPSAWSNITALQVKSGSLSAGSIDTYLSSNAFYSTASPSGWKYITSTTATQFYQNASGGEFVWRTAASGTAGNAITFTQAMTLDASANLSLNTTSSLAQFTVLSASSNAKGIALIGRSSDNASTIDFWNNAGSTRYAFVYADGNGPSISSVGALPLILGTNSAERGRFTSGGILSLQSSTANGVYLQSAADFAMASNATVAITSFTAGACLILVYEPATGDGGMFWANFTAVVTKVAGDGSATDAGSTFAVYKSAAGHTTTIKNRYGVSKNFRIAVYSAQANP